MNVFLAGCYPRPDIVAKTMNLYLAESGGIWNAYMKDEDFIGVKILDLFLYKQRPKDDEPYSLLL